MCFSGGSTDYTTGDNSEGFGGGVINNLPVALKLTLRRGVDDELYLDNLGSRIVEDSPTELKIKLYQGGEIVLVRTAAPVGPQAAIYCQGTWADPLVPAPRTSTIFGYAPLTG